MSRLFYGLYDGAPVFAGRLTDSDRKRLRAKGAEILTKITGEWMCTCLKAPDCKSPSDLIYLVDRSEQQEEQMATQHGFHTGWSMGNFMSSFPELFDKPCLEDQLATLLEAGLVSEKDVLQYYRSKSEQEDELERQSEQLARKLASNFGALEEDD